MTMSGCEKFKEEFPGKEKFHFSLTNKNNTDEGYEHVPKVWDRFKMRKNKKLKNINCT